MKNTGFTRRNVLQLAAVGAAVPLFPKWALANDEILLGGINDISGPLDLSGIPMSQALAYAVKTINDNGGLLGRNVRLVEKDAQSNMQLYGPLAQELALKDQVAAVQGGLISPAREIIRTALSRVDTPYFYNTQYEGGVCDRNTFCTGTTPTQTITHLVDHAAQNWGNKVFILAADFLWGQTLAKWVEQFTADNGGEVLGIEYLPFELNNFGSIIAKIQAAQPDYVMAITGGTPHLAFFQQWMAAGMKDKIPLASPSVPSAGKVLYEQLSDEELEGVVGCIGYFEELDTPENKAFLSGLSDMFGDDLDYMNELSCATYEGTMLWAKAVETAGTTDRMPVIEALESGLSIVGPSGLVTIDPEVAPHHPRHLSGRVQGRRMGHPAEIRPAGTDLDQLGL